jgi:hypothetical protein
MFFNPCRQTDSTLLILRLLICFVFIDESEDPSSSPLVWICKWVDYSDKYGFGYHLSDDSIGVSFNDQTKIILLSDSRSMHYIGKSGKEQYHKIDDFPDELIKKVKLLKYFQQYMQDNLMKVRFIDILFLIIICMSFLLLTN